MSAPTTIALSLPDEQLDLLTDLQRLLRRQAEQWNVGVWLEEPAAAARLGVSKSTLRKWRADGWLRHYVVDSVVRYRADYLDADFEARALVEAPRRVLHPVRATPPAKRRA